MELWAEVLESETTRSHMKHWKKVLGSILGGFLLFAPPGTLILLSLMLVGLFGRKWLIAVFVVVSATLAIWIVRRRSFGRSSTDR
jgi:membrane protein implicated in regulation of membrane protease activity